MKNIYFFIMLSSITFLYGTERTPLISQQKERYDSNPTVRLIERCTDIMHMPMRDIKCSVEALGFMQQAMFKCKLASSYTFNIAMLPKDLCLYILKIAYGDEGDDKRADNQISSFCEPMLYVSALNKELRDNPIKIGDKEISLCAYLTRSKQERNKLRSATNPSWASRFFEGKSEHVFSQEDYATIIEVLPDGIEPGQLVRLPSCWDRVKMGLCGDDFILGDQCGQVLSFLVGAQVLLVAGGVWQAIFGPNVLSYTFYGVGATVNCYALGNGIFCVIPRWRNHVVAQAHSNDGV